MIFTSFLPTSVDLSEKFSDFLMHDTVPNMKAAFSMMGRRFIGQPRKQQVANGIAKYVREHPLDVLRKCESDTLMYIKKMIEMGKGSHITIGEPEIYQLQIQKMELVLTYFDKINGHTELYLLDELHDLFAPHIDEAYKNPSDVLEKEMVQHLGKMADEINSAKDPEAKAKELLLEAMLFWVSNECDKAKNTNARRLREKFPAEMSDEELSHFAAELQQQEKDLNEAMESLSKSLKEVPQAVLDKKSKEISAATREVNEVLDGIESLKVMVDRSKRSSTDFEGVMKELQAAYPMDEDDLYMEEITFKVQIDNTPIYRTLKVIDRCSMFELNMLIQFLFNWNEMHPHAFKYQYEGTWQIISPRTRLSELFLEEGEEIHFLYDSEGDKWEHTLTVLAIDDYDGKEADYEPRCIAGSGPDPGERAGGNAWLRRNLPYVMKNKKKYFPFNKSEINDTIHFWWTVERQIWIEKGIIKYDD